MELVATSIEEDGLSKRVRSQLNLFNAIVGVMRFVGKVLIKGIKGRKKAEEIENQHIDAYEKKHGRKPRANRK